MASNFSNGGNRPDLNALLEQVSLLCCIYWNAREQAQAIINEISEGSILAWNWNDRTIPPSWFAWGYLDQVFITISGTQNKEQFIRDVLGYLGSPYPDSTARVNAFFYLMALNLKAQIERTFPSGFSGKKIHIAAHSLGASCGMLLGIELAKVYGRQNVEFLGFGQPKTLTNSPISNLPSVLMACQNRGDFVPYLPNNQLNFIIPLASGFVLSSPLDWTHQASQTLLTTDGFLVDETNSVFDTALDVATFVQDGFRHPIALYAENIITAWNRENS